MTSENIGVGQVQTDTHIQLALSLISRNTFHWGNRCNVIGKAILQIGGKYVFYLYRIT